MMPCERFVSFNLATETPRVINITGIAIWPVNSNEFVINCGVFKLKYKNTAPKIAPQAVGSFSNVFKVLSPLIIQIPMVKEKIAIIAKIITA